MKNHEANQLCFTLRSEGNNFHMLFIMVIMVMGMTIQNFKNKSFHYKLDNNGKKNKEKC